MKLKKKTEERIEKNKNQTLECTAWSLKLSPALILYLTDTQLVFSAPLNDWRKINQTLNQ